MAHSLLVQPSQRQKIEGKVDKDDLTTTKTSRSLDICLVSGSHKKMLLSMAGAAEKRPILHNKTASKRVAKLQLLPSHIFQRHIAELISKGK